MPDNRLTPLARKLRRDATEVEAMLWQRLRNRQVEGAKFRRQVPVGGYIADFLCVDARLVIELDGGQHATRAEADAARTRAIETAGYVVLRFWNSGIVENLDGVLEEIRSAILTARNL
jgi:very-short-patch-repair endonuclease